MPQPPSDRSHRRFDLVRRLNDMLPVPEASSLQLVLSLRTRLLAVRCNSLSPSESRATVRRLVADLVVALAVFKHLAPLFEKTETLLDSAQNAQTALARTAQRWKNRENPLSEDLETLETFADLFYEVVRQTKLSEYKTVLQLVEKELAR